MESEEIRELRAMLAKLKQEHRDLDSAINALEESGRADPLQLKRLKKKKLSLKDEIAPIVSWRARIQSPNPAIATSTTRYQLSSDAGMPSRRMLSTRPAASETMKI